MNALDVLTSPWAMLPSKLQEIQRIYERRQAGASADLAPIEAALGRPLENKRAPMEVRNGVAIIPLDGVIAKRMNLFTQISGGTSSELAGQDLQQALADTAVHSVILHIDSPGGTVDGTQQLANSVYAARQRKPIVTLASGVMASAAYWIGSAAHAAYITEQTTLTGSIGVVVTHVDKSRAEAQQGLKLTEIYAGKYKRLVSEHNPLSDAGLQTMQEQVDFVYSVFVGDVARNRGVTVDATLRDMADGRTFIGSQAIAAGLVDGLSSLDALVAKLTAAATATGRR